VLAMPRPLTLRILRSCGATAQWCIRARLVRRHFGATSACDSDVDEDDFSRWLMV
jgi:hypothetical protein